METPVSVIFNDCPKTLLDDRKIWESRFLFPHDTSQHLIERPPISKTRRFGCKEKKNSLGTQELENDSWDWKKFTVASSCSKENEK